MANLKGIGGMKQLNLLATIDPKHVTKKDGATTGAYIDMQKDLSGFSDDEIKAGLVDLNPHLVTRTMTGRNGKQFQSHNAWYSQEQIMAMRMAGQTATTKDGRTVIAFKGDVQMQKDAKTGETLVTVVTPRDLDKAKSADSRNKMRLFNENHPLGRSDNFMSFDADILERHERVLRKAQSLQKEKQAEPAKAPAEADKTVDKMKRQNLIASYTPDDVVVMDGRIVGAFATVQRDQSMLSKADIQAGKATADPFLTTDKAVYDVPGGKLTRTDHMVYYPIDQLDAMESAGVGIWQDTGERAIAFKADLQEVRSSSGSLRLLVVTSPESLGKSDNRQFGSDSLYKQNVVTTQAKLAERQKSREAKLSSMGFDNMESQQQDSMELG